MENVKVLLLGVSRYDFKNDRGETVQGTTVHYVSLTKNDNNNVVGYIPTKANFPFNEFEKYEGYQFPITAEAELTFDLGNRRNPIKITGFELKDLVVL